MVDEEEIEISDDIDELLSEDAEEEIESELDIDNIADEIEDVEVEQEPEISNETELREEIEDILADDDLSIDDELTADDEQKLEEELILPEEEEVTEAAEPELMDELKPEEEEEDPMAALKDISAETAGDPKESFDKLKTLSKKIIDGETIDIGVDIKSEIKELLDLIFETKKRVDEIGPSLATSNEHIPNVLSTLESVTETTEDATLNLMENADGLNNYYQEFIGEIDDLEELVLRKDTGSILKKILKLESDIQQADSMGFNILHALEFQDITEQKLHKVINAVRDIGGRLGAILGFIKLKSENDPTIVDDASQDDIDKLLADFGLD